VQRKQTPAGNKQVPAQYCRRAKTQGTLRAPLVGRAIHVVNDNDTFLYMMIRGNVDLFAELFPWAHEELGSVPYAASEDYDTLIYI